MIIHVATLAALALCLFDHPRRSLQKMRRFIGFYRSRRPAKHIFIGF
jgi:hypothetical protein